MLNLLSSFHDTACIFLPQEAYVSSPHPHSGRPSHEMHNSHTAVSLLCCTSLRFRLTCPQHRKRLFHHLTLDAILTDSKVFTSLMDWDPPGDTYLVMNCYTGRVRRLYRSGFPAYRLSHAKCTSSHGLQQEWHLQRITSFLRGAHFASLLWSPPLFPVLLTCRPATAYHAYRTRSSLPAC